MDHPSDMALFQRVLRLGSLSAAARDAGLTPAAISKRLAGMEARLGVRLLHRTTRRISLTDEGELYAQLSARILAEIAEMEDTVSLRRAAPRGLLRVNATFGFGRRWVAPLVSDFAAAHPEVEVQLQLTERPIALEAEGFDVDIRVGGAVEPHLIARRIAPGERVVCATPAYLERHGTPAAPRDLARFDCVVLRDNDAAFGVWKFTGPRGSETVKVRGRFSSNDGEIVHAWVLRGHGIMLRSTWDVAANLASGKLVRLLPDWKAPDANIYAVYSAKGRQSARVRAFIEYLASRFAARRSWLEPPG